MFFVWRATNSTGKIFQSMKLLVFAMIVTFLTPLGVGVKFSSAPKFLGIGILESLLLHVTMEYEQKYWPIFLLVFCSISACLARI